MKNKGMIIFLTAIFIIGTLNFAYANGGPEIGPNQAKKIAQNYLNANNLPYTAITPGNDDWQIEVKGNKTGEVKWISVPEYQSNLPDSSGNFKYELIDGNPIWIVHVNDKNETIGQIYVDTNTGTVLKAIIQGKVLKDDLNKREQLNGDYYASTELTDPIDQALQSLVDNIGIILGIFGAILIIGIGIGYLAYKRM